MTPKYYLKVNLKDAAYFADKLNTSEYLVNLLPCDGNLTRLPEILHYLQNTDIGELWEPIQAYTSNLFDLMYLVDILKNMDTNPIVDFNLNTCTEEYLVSKLDTERAKVLYNFIEVLRNVNSN